MDLIAPLWLRAFEHNLQKCLKRSAIPKNDTWFRMVLGWRREQHHIYFAGRDEDHMKEQKAGR